MHALKRHNPATKAEPRRRAVGYARVSTREQADRRFSIDEQRRRIREHARAAGLELVRVVVDAGVSARRSLDRRPGGAELLELLELERADVVIAVDHDRLFRSAAEALARADEWRRGSVSLRLLNFHGGEVDTTSAHGWLVFHQWAGIAEFEARRLGERTREGLAARRRAGVALGRPAYGQRQRAGARVPVPLELATIDTMQRRRNDGASYPTIAAELNAAGIKTSTGARWYPATVRRILLRRNDA